MGFRLYLQKLAPTSLQRTRFGELIAELGGSLDDAAALTKSAVKARLPGVAATDSVDAIAGDRQLEKNTTTDVTAPAGFAARVKDAWARWAWGGTAYGLLRELWVLGYRHVHVVTVRGKSYTLQSDTGVPGADLVVGALMPQSWWPSGVTVGVTSQMPVGAPRTARDWWTRFSVIFDAPLPTPATGAPSDWTAALPAADSAEVDAIRRVIKRWAPAIAVCDRIVVLTSGNLLGWPVGTTLTTFGALGARTVTYWSP